MIKELTIVIDTSHQEYDQLRLKDGNIIVSIMNLFKGDEYKHPFIHNIDVAIDRIRAKEFENANN